MRYTITMPQRLYEETRRALLKDGSDERAGFLFARVSKTDAEERLLLREFMPIEPKHVIHTDAAAMTIDSAAAARAMKYANDTKQCLVFVHSHPNALNHFSLKDDVNESNLFRAAYVRIDGASPHASLVLPQCGDPFARVWLRSGEAVDVDRIRVFGRRFLFFDQHRAFHSPEFFDRQILAFGENTQTVLSSLHIAVVGAGGTGSAIIEQLVRLGVGNVSIYDGQTLELTNVSRVFGSRANDNGRYKVEILADWGRQIGVGTLIKAWPKNITDDEVARSLRDADVIFGCTDDEWGRSILNEIAIRYFIPVIDMAVKIPSQDGLIHSVCGRVTVLEPESSCLFCRGRISPERIKAESDAARDPEEAAALVKEGYAPELDMADPSVIPFTSAIASFAVTEFLHRLTGFMGNQRRSTEVIHIFDRSETHTNATPPSQDCKCTQAELRGIGDTRNFLGMLWPKKQ
jgi:molybdopterin/thiamine biosynthesis adenylyltransferase/proteasome lid subunit RPN8/RPN11